MWVKRHLAVDILGFPFFTHCTKEGNLDLCLWRLDGGRERSNAWVKRCKSLVKNFDHTLARSNAKLKLCFIRLMLKRLEFRLSRSKNMIAVRLENSSQERQWSLVTSYQTQP
jgi:hypothetical protein